MDLNEISTFSHRKQRISKNFCLRTSPCGRFYGLMLVDRAVMRRITHCPTTDISTVNFQVSELSCPEGIATQSLPKDFDAIYDGASFEERTSMVVDPMMCFKYLESVSISLIDLQISPCLNSEEFLVAAQNSMGCLHIFSLPEQFQIQKRDWLMRLDVAKALIEMRRSEDAIKTFQDLKSTIQDYIISAFAWTMTGQEVVFKFCALMRNGVAVFCSFDGHTMEINFESDLQIPNSNKIKWFRFQELSYLVASVATGQIYLFRVDEEAKQCVGVATLWPDADYLLVDHLEVNSDGEEVLLFAVKDCFLISVTMSKEENIFCRCDELGRAAICGITHLNAWDYLVIFSDRLTKHIQISNSGTEINLAEININNNLAERYTFFGAVASPHKLFWMLAAELLQPHDIHNWANCSVIVTICTFSHGNCPLELLSHPPTDFLSHDDSKEAMRIRWYKESDVNPHYLDLVAHPLDSTEESLINLRKRLIYLGAKSGSLKLGYESQSLLFLEEFNYIRRVLVALGFHRSLKRLKRHHQATKSLTKFQLNAVKHFTVGIREFLLAQSPEEYEPGLESLRVILEEDLLTTNLAKSVPNLCQICRKEVDEDNLTCPDGHEMNRCILTNFQVFIMNEAVCSQCNQVIINDRMILTQTLLLDSDEVIMCPVCDIPIKVD